MMKVYVLIVRHFGAEEGDITNEDVWVYETMADAKTRLMDVLRESGAFTEPVPERPRPARVPRNRRQGIERATLRTLTAFFNPDHSHISKEANLEWKILEREVL